MILHPLLYTLIDALDAPNGLISHDVLVAVDEKIMNY